RAAPPPLPPFPTRRSSDLDRDRVEDRIDRDPAAVCRRGVRTLHPGKDHLLPERDAELLVGAQQLGIDLVKGFRTVLEALRTGVVILVLEVDLRVVEHRPVRLLEPDPAARGVEPPLGHPPGFLVLL